MNKNINECLDYYIEEINDINSISDGLNELNSFISKTEKFKNKDCLFFIKDTHSSTISLNEQDSIQDAKDFIEWFDFSDGNKIKLILKCEKKSENNIDIIDKEAFISTTNELSDLAQIKLVVGLHRKDIKSININKKQILLDNFIVSNETNHAIFYRKDKISDLSEFELYPCYIDFLCQKLSSDEIIIVFLRRVRAILCLALLAKKANLSEDKSVFIFEDDISITPENYTDKDLNDNSDVIYDIYKWVYNDEKYISKLGILWHLISKSFNTNKLFKINTLSTLQSLHQIYLKEDFANYIDLRNKVSDSIIELTNKIIENIQHSRTGIKQTLFVTMSYFFLFLYLQL